LMEHRERRERWKFHCIQLAQQQLRRRLSNPRPIDAGSESASLTDGGRTGNY
jgi:hypothetical protein